MAQTQGENMGKMRDIKEIKARIAELERTYDDRGGCQNPQNEKLLIERAALIWVLGGTGAITHKGMW